MANTSSAFKAIRQTERRSIKNLARKQAYKSARKAVVKAVAAGEPKVVAAELQNFYKAVDKAAKHNGPLHKNTAARYKSRLTRMVNKTLA